MITREETKKVLRTIDCDGDTQLIYALERAMWSMKNAQILRNELCNRCGNYINEHQGACDGCRWKEDEVD